jgi:hypothetical protein
MSRGLGRCRSGSFQTNKRTGRRRGWQVWQVWLRCMERCVSHGCRPLLHDDGTSAGRQSSLAVAYDSFGKSLRGLRGDNALCAPHPSTQLSWSKLAQFLARSIRTRARRRRSCHPRSVRRAGRNSFSNRELVRGAIQALRNAGQPLVVAPADRQPIQSRYINASSSRFTGAPLAARPSPLRATRQSCSNLGSTPPRSYGWDGFLVPGHG